MSQLSVLLIPSWYPTDTAPGAGVFIREHAKAMQRAGIRVGIVYPELRGLSTLSPKLLLERSFSCIVSEEDGIPVVRVTGVSLRIPSLNRRLFSHAALKAFRTFCTTFWTPDILHAHACIWGGVAAHAIAKETGIPYCITEHSSEYRRGAVPRSQIETIRSAFGNANLRIAVSESLAQTIHQSIGVTDFTILGNGVETGKFIPAEKPKGAFTFLSTGNLVPYKGMQDLINAFAMAFGDDPGTKLVIAGDGPMRPALEKMITQHNLSEQITMAGQVTPDKLAALMRSANAFVSPSHMETFGVAIAEALSSNLPVVVTRSGGPESFVTSEVGILTPPKRPAELANALRSMKQNAASYGNAPRKHALAHLGWPQIISRLQELYAEVLKQS